MGRDGKQNHYWMEDGAKGEKKIHAGLQIEKIREREKEDSPLTKNPAPPWQLKKKKKLPGITEGES